MRKLLPLQNRSVLSFLVLALFVLSCANGRETRNAPASSPVSSNQQPVNSNSNANQGHSESKTLSFATNVICALPNEVATSTPFANLGGGAWGQWDKSDGELAYGCNGGKDQIWLVDNDDLKISAEYGVIGEVQKAHQVSAEYMAVQYSGLRPSEKRWRAQYADFCDKLSVKFYGVELPEKFRKRLMDESKYSTSDTSNEYAEKIGQGYVNLSSSKNKATIMLDVHFFSSEAEYRKYKNS